VRELAPRVLGTLVRRFRDFAACEDAVQEALLAAATQWPASGVPDEPLAWLVRVASRRIVDQVRAEAARRRREAIVVSLIPPEEQLALAPDEAADDASAGDDSLVLLFMCCHPALSTASAIALTLRAVGGLTTAEIASAFLVPEATMAQRISRAKASIKASAIPFAMPDETDRKARSSAVLHVLYLVFNEGYATSAGPTLERDDLADEAIRLARMLHARLPDDGEVLGLLALMLLTQARRDARTGPAGELIPLDEQDRSRWDRLAVAEGVALVSRAFEMGTVGTYALEAAIAALHDEASSAESTDWPQILALYEVRLRLADNPVVALNHAVAFAMVNGPARGLERLDSVAGDPRLRASHRVDAVRAHLLERLGERESALAHYALAAQRATNLAERNYLLVRAARLRERERP